MQVAKINITICISGISWTPLQSVRSGIGRTLTTGRLDRVSKSEAIVSITNNIFKHLKIDRRKFKTLFLWKVHLLINTNKSFETHRNIHFFKNRIVHITPSL